MLSNNCKFFHFVEVSNFRGYMRLNVACPRQILSSALKNLAAAVKIYENMSK